MGVIYRIIIFLVLFNLVFFALKYGDEMDFSEPDSESPSQPERDEVAHRFEDVMDVEVVPIMRQGELVLSTNSTRGLESGIKTGGGATTMTSEMPSMDDETPEINDGTTLTEVLTALGDADPVVRIVALNELAMRSEVQAIATIESLLYDPDTKVRIAAIQTLGDLEHELAVIPLAGLLNDADASVRRSVVIALGEIGGGQVAGFVDTMVYDSDPLVKSNASSILTEVVAEMEKGH
jgi:hypothetical protein